MMVDNDPSRRFKGWQPRGRSQWPLVGACRRRRGALTMKPTIRSRASARRRARARRPCDRDRLGAERAPSKRDSGRSDAVAAARAHDQRDADALSGVWNARARRRAADAQEGRPAIDFARRRGPDRGRAVAGLRKATTRSGLRSTRNIPRELQALLSAVSGNAQAAKSYTQRHVGRDKQPARPQRPAVWCRSVRPAKAPFGVYSESTVTNESATITVTQLIYDGGRTIAASVRPKEADIAGRATLLRQLQTLALNIANAYYAVLEDNATVTADAQLVHEFEVNEASVAAQIRNGAAPRSDIAAAQFQTAQAQGQSRDRARHRDRRASHFRNDARPRRRRHGRAEAATGTAARRRIRPTRPRSSGR